ncbi:hypothetical protein AB0K40_17600 [Nonomuraea bangladeshensis]|uniref:Uncharacterized protein n=1 Tax=Nonomuraea bangladeshensis TaxID=404385 RepID=A0ABV3H479_9ACTN
MAKTPARKPAAKKTARKRRRIKVAVTFALFRCSRCRRNYNLPWRHTCMIGFTAAEARRAQRLAMQARKTKRPTT